MTVDDFFLRIRSEQGKKLKTVNFRVTEEFWNQLTRVADYAGRAQNIVARELLEIALNSAEKSIERREQGGR